MTIKICTQNTQWSALLTYLCLFDLPSLYQARNDNFLMCNKFLPIYMNIHIWNVLIDVYFSHLLSDSLDSFLNYRHKTSFDIKNDVGLQIFRRFPKAPLIFELEIWDLRNFLGELLGLFSQYPQLQGFSGQSLYLSSWWPTGISSNTWHNLNFTNKLKENFPKNFSSCKSCFETMF